MFEAIDLKKSAQVAVYDDGVGTSSFKPIALLGGAFGFGLKRNVIGLYKFLCRNYRSAADYKKIADDEAKAKGSPPPADKDANGNPIYTDDQMTRSRLSCRSTL